VEEGIQLRLRAESLAHEKAEALKIAVRQSAVRTQFLANISHELRTPLHGILGMARVLQTELKDEPALLQRADLISSSGSHLLSLINDLLDLSRIDAGQFLLRQERHDLSAQVAQLAGIYAMRCDGKDLHFTLQNTLPETCWVTGDPARFRQVLHNLLGNAVKFTQRGGVTLAVGRNPATGMVRVEVHDTGPGIPSTDLDRIFEAFHQSDGGMAALSSEGAGLGLTIARDIARAMGGDIVVASVAGGGTTMVFTACLPSAQAPHLEAESAPSDRGATAPALAATVHLDAEPAASLQQSGAEETSDSASQESSEEDKRDNGETAAEGASSDDGVAPDTDDKQSSNACGRCLALLAEDNDINALVATNFLEIIGVQSERVKDGQEAVREALRSGTQHHRRPDIILMDCQMPVMTGHEAARMIRAKEQAMGLARIPIVALTATASDTERQDCLEAGMDDFLSKPCTLEDLSRAIARWSPVQHAGSELANVVCITQPQNAGSPGPAPLDGNHPPPTRPGASSLRA
jgi:CheY-like chemotaxis protein